MAVAADLLLVHVVQEEILCILELVGHARINAGEVVGEWADIVVMVLGPAREVFAREFAACPGDAEGRLGSRASLDGVLQRGAELVCVHEMRHGISSLDGLYTIYYSLRWVNAGRSSACYATGATNGIQKCRASWSTKPVRRTRAR